MGILYNIGMKITRVKIGAKSNYVICEEQYQEGGYTVNQKQTIDIIKKDGGQVITVYTDYNGDCDDSNTYIKRIEKVAKGAGYKNNVKIQTEYYQIGNFRREQQVIKGQFIKQ